MSEKSYSEAEIELMLEGYFNLDSRVGEIGNAYFRAIEDPGAGSYCEWSIDGNTVYMEGDEYWRYGGHEHHFGHFPLELLWNSDLIEQARLDHLQAKEEQARQDEQIRINHRRKQLEQLKKEFGES